MLLVGAQLALALALLEGVLRSTPERRQLAAARLEVGGPAIGPQDLRGRRRLAATEREPSPRKLDGIRLLPRRTRILRTEPRAQIGEVRRMVVMGRTGHCHITWSDSRLCYFVLHERGGHPRQEWA